MTSAEVKRALRAMGLVAEVRKAKGRGHDYTIRRGGIVIGSGWDNGNATDALNSAYEHAIDMQRRAAVGGAA